MSTTVLCPSCKKLLPPDSIHSCYDHDAVERLLEAERRVIAAAESWRDACEDEYDLTHAVVKAVDALREARG